MYGVCGNTSNILRDGPCNSSRSNPRGIPVQIIFIRESTEVRSPRGGSTASCGSSQVTLKRLSSESPEMSSAKNHCAALESSFLDGLASCLCLEKR